MSEPTGQARVVAGVDGSDCSIDALRLAIDEARRRGAVVQALYAFASPTLVGVIPPQEYFDDLQVQASKDLDDAVAKATAGIEDLPPIIRTVVSESAGAALVGASEGATLLVVGSRGLGGFRELMLGSVSAQCVRHAHCSVMVVRPPE
ncbi:MAG: universal stress protein [Acidimicrobiales bacterium]